MKERRLYKRHMARLPSRIEAIIPGGTKKIYDFETKDISIGGVFLFTNESLSFPQETRFIMDITIPKGSMKELMNVKSLMECTGTMVRSTSEGIAIQCSDKWEIMNIRGS